ncbi:HNH endonuclease [Dyella sp. 2RAF44]|uniref:HNH endonuclease n=1 Tax=Dyella sp. 2RAF44 TaxID=3233000 RepID=UPI003F90D651
MIFEIGALYNRQRDIHAVYRGQERGGISTPSDSEFIFLFTGESGKAHGYNDYVDEDGFHLYGEGQSGDMEFTGGNRAIRDHRVNGKRLLLFQSLGKSRPYRYLGEYALAATNTVDAPSTASRTLRKAIVFTLRRIAADEEIVEQQSVELRVLQDLSLESTTTLSMREVRTKQALFRDNVLRMEKGCRITGIQDLRFLRASHIKPWSKCSDANERVDGANGLLLAPHIDHLFDRGWISFENSGRVILSPELPPNVLSSLGVEVESIKKKPFNQRQAEFLRYHRQNVLRLE